MHEGNNLLLFTDSNFIWQIYYIFYKVTIRGGPTRLQTVTLVTDCPQWGVTLEKI